MSRKYKFNNPSGLYFVSFATVSWVDVFTRQVYFEILAESVSYCRANKGMELYAYCFMTNHVHLMFRSASNDPSGLIRDFKSFTSRNIVEAIKENVQESRKGFLLEIFKTKTGHQFWQHHNKPIELWSTAVIKQKLDYIHNNPVKQGFVTDPTHWKYSSARNYADDHTIMAIDDIGFSFGRMS
ncbi:REP-associated tyrosine transposase [Sediminicola luteus]|uniref:Transposase n=1 Tax=Sediminicola luteus TaxID=319238 RepID=A0A2A4G481_9FLAO|nr:transposase [Sediminicola luteus]PCE62780.1 transposase [Sediminicola luteus]